MVGIIPLYMLREAESLGTITYTDNSVTLSIPRENRNKERSKERSDGDRRQITEY